MVRQIFDWVGRERLSLGEVCRRLQQAGERTRTGKTVWDRTVVWAILKNPAYKGTAAFGKTREVAPRPKLRLQRGDPAYPRRPKATVDVPPEDWLYIPVPALVSEALFEVVQHQLAENRQRARQGQRGARYLLQGLLVCAGCQYAYYGKPVSNKAAKGKIRDYAYYRCIGTDAYRFGGERICDNLQVRTDKLDEWVWQEVCALLKQPRRLQQEYERRLDAPQPHHQDLLTTQAQLSKVRQGMARLIDGYTEGFIEKQEFEPRIQRLRQRLSTLQDREQQIRLEVARQVELRLIITRLEEFAAQVKDKLTDADWQTKRDLIRTLVKRVEIGKEEVNIVFRVIPDPFDSSPDRGSLQHRWRRNYASLGCTLQGSLILPVLDNSGLEHLFNQVENGRVFDPALDEFYQDVVLDVVETAFNISFNNPQIFVLSSNPTATGTKAIHRPASWSKAIRTVQKVAFPDGFKQHLEGHLDHSVFEGGDAQRS